MEGCRGVAGLGLTDPKMMALGETQPIVGARPVPSPDGGVDKRLESVTPKEPEAEKSERYYRGSDRFIDVARYLTMGKLPAVHWEQYVHTGDLRLKAACFRIDPKAIMPCTELTTEMRSTFRPCAPNNRNTLLAHTFNPNYQYICASIEKGCSRMQSGSTTSRSGRW